MVDHLGLPDNTVQMVATVPKLIIKPAVEAKRVRDWETAEALTSSEGVSTALTHVLGGLMSVAFVVAVWPS